MRDMKEMKQTATFCGFIFVLLLVTSTHLESVLGETVTCSGESDSDIYTGNRRCASGWKYLKGTQHSVCIKIFEKRNYDDAVKMCKDRGGDVLGDIQALKQCFDGISHPDVNAIWRRGSTIKKKKCQVWNVGIEAPRNIPCDSKRYFLCGKTPSAPSTKTTMTTTATEMIFATTIKDSLCPSSDSSKCPEGWLDVGFGKCLMIRPMRLQRWHDANKECKSKGAELLTELEMTALFKAVIACKDKVKITIPMRQSVWIQGCKRTEFPGLRVVSNDADPCSAENVLLVVCIASVGDRVTALKESDVQGFFSSLDGSRQESLDMAETDLDTDLIRRPYERLITRVPDIYKENLDGALLVPSPSTTTRRTRTTTPMTTTTTMTVWVSKTKDSSCPIPDISRCSKGWLDVGLGICLLIRPVPEGLKHGEQANRECTKMNAGLLNEVQIASLIQTVLACKDKVNFPITMKQSVWLQGCKSIGFQGLQAVFHDPCTTHDVWLLVCAANVGDNVTALPESDLQSPLSSLGGSQRESVDLAEAVLDPELIRRPYEGLSTGVPDIHRENSDGAPLVPSRSSTRRRKRTTATMATTTILVTTTKQDYSCPVSNSSDCSEGWLHVGRGICLMLMNKPSGLETLEQANQECVERHARLFDEKEITPLFQTMIGCQDKLAIPIPVDLIDIKPRVWLQEGCKKFEIQASTVVSNGPCTTQDGHLLVCAANVGDNVPAIPEFDLLRFLSPGGGSRTMSVELPWFDLNLKFKVPSIFNPVVDFFDSQEDDLDVVQTTTTSTKTSTTTSMTTTTEELCPDLDNDLCPDENWLNVGTGKCLHAHPMPIRTWEEARTQCERLNAHLLTSEELALIQPTCFKKLSKRNGIPSLFLRERSVWIDGCKRVRLSWPEMIVDEICLSRDVKFLLCAVDDSISEFELSSSATSHKEPLSETSSETSQKNIESGAAQENLETGKDQQVAETATVVGIPVVVIPVIIVIIITVDIIAIVIYKNRDRLKCQFGLLPVSDNRNLKNAEEGNIDPDLNDSGSGKAAKNEDDQCEGKSSDGNMAEKNTNEAEVEKSGEEGDEVAICGDKGGQMAPSDETGEEEANDGREEKTGKDKEDMKSGDEAEGKSSGEKKEEKTGEEKGEEKPDGGKEDTSGDGKGEGKSGDEKEGEESLDKDACEKSKVSNTEEKSDEKDAKAPDGEKEGEKTGAEKEEKEISSENDGEKSDEGKVEDSAG